MDDDVEYEPLLWPKAKPRMAHAKRSGDLLIESMAAWTKQHPMHSDFELSPDGMGFELVFDRFDPEPPMDDWAVQFGAIAHQYRTVLDIAIEELARLAGAPKNYRRHFPILVNREDWKKELKSLAGLPQLVIDAIYGMQPFVHHRGEQNPRDHVLSVLAWTDNRDKHEDLLALNFLADRFDFSAVAHFDDPDIEFDKVAVVTKALDFMPGSPLVTVRTEPHKISSLESADVWLSVEPAVLDYSGARTFVIDALNEFVQMTMTSVVTLSAAWEDSTMDFLTFAGSTDRLQGASFGRAAINSIHGEGTWEKDFRRTPRYTEHQASKRLERSFERMKRTGTLPDAAG